MRVSFADVSEKLERIHTVFFLSPLFWTFRTHTQTRTRKRKRERSHSVCFYFSLFSALRSAPIHLVSFFRFCHLHQIESFCHWTKQTVMHVICIRKECATEKHRERETETEGDRERSKHIQTHPDTQPNTVEWSGVDNSKIFGFLSFYFFFCICCLWWVETGKRTYSLFVSSARRKQSRIWGVLHQMEESSATNKMQSRTMQHYPSSFSLLSSHHHHHHERHRCQHQHIRDSDSIAHYLLWFCCLSKSEVDDWILWNRMHI